MLDNRTDELIDRIVSKGVHLGAVATLSFIIRRLTAENHRAAADLLLAEFERTVKIAVIHARQLEEESCPTTPQS